MKPCVVMNCSGEAAGRLATFPKELGREVGGDGLVGEWKGRGWEWVSKIWRHVMQDLGGHGLTRGF